MHLLLECDLDKFRRSGNSHEYGYPEDTFQNILWSHRVSQSDMNAICVFGGSSCLSATNAENQQIAKQTPSFTPNNVKLGVFVLFKK